LSRAKPFTIAVRKAGRCDAYCSSFKLELEPMIETFSFPFTRWNLKQGDSLRALGISDNCPADIDPFIDWVNDAHVENPHDLVSIAPGWFLAFNRVIEPDVFVFRRCKYALRESGWERDTIGFASHGELREMRIDNVRGEPLEMHEEVLVEAMIVRLHELSAAAFAALPRRQREWLERCHEKHILPGSRESLQVKR
jgi:hypothetical protein